MTEPMPATGGIRFHTQADALKQDVIVQMHGDREVGVQLRIFEWDADRMIAHTYYDPDIVLPRHSHASDTLVYILDGEVSIEGRSCPAGTQIVIPKDVPLGPLIVGPEGCTFLESYAGDFTATHHDPEGYARLLAERGITPVPTAALTEPEELSAGR
jgi:hypothetical protein